MIVLGKILCLLVLFVITCKAPVSVEYIQPTSCSSNEFYQISNLSCVDCATNRVKANNGMQDCCNKILYGWVFIGISKLFIYYRHLVITAHVPTLCLWGNDRYILLQDGYACSAVMVMILLLSLVCPVVLAKNMVSDCVIISSHDVSNILITSIP